MRNRRVFLKNNNCHIEKKTTNHSFRKTDTTYAQATKHQEMNGGHEGYDDDVEPFWDEKPEEEDVFLPTQEPLKPVNMYLERAAWIGLQVGVYSPAFLEAVKRMLAHIHGGLASSYQIEKTGRNKYSIVFQDEQLRDVAVHERPYGILALGAQFTLTAWQLTDGMQYHPPRYEAWVRLVGTPLHMWNSEGIHRITTRMGTVKGTMPYGLHARQLEHSIVHMATKHPRNIPKWLNITANVENFICNLPTNFGLEHQLQQI